MSNAATIKRGARPGARPKVSGRRKPPPKRKSMLVTTLERLPIPFELVQRVFGYSVVLLAIVLAGTAATLMGLPQMAGVAAAEMTGRAGFAVKRIELTGIDRMERMTVYAIAAEQNEVAMPLVDLDDVRAKLMAQGWIAEARVSRRLPDTLLIDIVERKPAAIWQNAQALTLIDASGVALEPVALDAMPDLPLVIGPDANMQVSGLGKLVEAAPALRPMLAGATWIGKRRWDLRFQSGETLALPEGEREAADALVRFARMDGTRRLLGRGFLRFDMRVPGRFYVRVPNGQKRIDTVDAAAVQPQAEVEKTVVKQQEGEDGAGTG